MRFIPLILSLPRNVSLPARHQGKSAIIPRSGRLNNNGICSLKRLTLFFEPVERLTLQLRPNNIEHLRMIVIHPLALAVRQDSKVNQPPVKRCKSPL